MPNSTSDRLKSKIPKIMNIWEKRVNEEIKAARHQETLELRDSLPDYLKQLVKALSTAEDNTNPTSADQKIDNAETTRLGKKHGRERAGHMNYTMDQLIFEYHILRQVICEVLEEDDLLTAAEREVIVCSIEQAVNDAATQFSETLKKFQEHLSHTLAHDLRNPLSAAKTSAQMILRQLDNQQGCADKTNRILKSIDRIDRMISELLDVSRSRAGETFDLEFREFDLEALLREIADESNLSYGNPFLVKSEGKCLGSWNEDGLRRLIENLASNAVKYGEVNRPVTILLDQDDENATISVHNEGEPIPYEEQSLLFEKFRRSKSSENKVGWGLGLAVVKDMVEAHKGTIKVKSEKGKGTTFVIVIPKNSGLRPEIGMTSEENLKLKNSDAVYKTTAGREGRAAQ